MHAKNHNIPKCYSWLIDRFISDSDTCHLKGDYEEIYAGIYRDKGRVPATLWVLRQILVSTSVCLFDTTNWSLAMLKNYFKIAFRNLTRHKGFSAINILGLAIGMACAILILQWVQDELSYDRFHEFADDLYIATFSNGSIITPTGLGLYLKNEYPEILYTSRRGTAGRDMLRTSLTEAYQNGGQFVDPDFLKMFSISFISGNPETALKDPHSIILSESVARKYFGNEDPLGKSMIYETRTNLIITGIFEDYPHNSHFNCEHILSVELLGVWGHNLNTWAYNNIRTYIMLKPGTESTFVDSKIADIVEKHRPQEQRPLHLQPIQRLHLNPFNDTGGTLVYVYLFSAMALFILLIACINFMNLTTARSTVRAREVGIRKTVGALKVHLIRQFFGESILMTSLSLMLAVGIIALVLPTFNQLTGKPFKMAFMLQRSTVFGVLGVAIITGLLSGSYPALFMSRFRPVRVLKGSFTSGMKGTFFRKILVVVQFTLSILLILGTLMIARQIQYLRGRDLGYDKEHVVYFGIGSRFRGQAETIKTEWLSSPHILNVSLMDTPPHRWNSNAGVNDVHWEGKTSQQVKMVMLSVDYDYVETFGLEMAQGRFFSKNFTTDSEDAFVVNEAAIRAMEITDPIGKELRVWDFSGRIVGVIKNYHFESLHNNIIPMAMRIRPDGYGTACVRINPSDVQGALAFLKEKWQAIYPEYPFEYRFLDDTLDNLYRAEERIGNIVRVLTVLAILISCMGLFGLASFATERRTKEIGIRKTCGASASGLVMLLSKEFFRLVLLACVIASPAAYVLMNQWLQTFAYRIPLSVVYALYACVLSLLIAFITVSFHTIRAARANPVNALRYE